MEFESSPGYIINVVIGDITWQQLKNNDVLLHQFKFAIELATAAAEGKYLPIMKTIDSELQEVK